MGHLRMGPKIRGVLKGSAPPTGGCGANRAAFQTLKNNGGRSIVGKKYVYMFSEGNKDMRELLGGKGANLAEMTKAGMPVPQGFT
ncbi:MAG: hypothetical protein ACLSDO_09140, partial [Anaerotruncus colihominis]